MDFLPQDFIVLDDVSEGGACHGCSGKTFPFEVVDDEVPNLSWKDGVGCFPLHFLFRLCRRFPRIEQIAVVATKVPWELVHGMR